MYLLVFAFYDLPGGFAVHAMGFTVNSGHQRQPKIVVEMQIQQRAIHIEHDGVDG